MFGFFYFVALYRQKVFGFDALGTASSLLQAMQQLGGSVGAAALTTVFVSVAATRGQAEGISSALASGAGFLAVTFRVTPSGHAAFRSRSRAIPAGWLASRSGVSFLRAREAPRQSRSECRSATRRV